MGGAFPGWVGCGPAGPRPRRRRSRRGGRVAGVGDWACSMVLLAGMGSPRIVVDFRQTSASRARRQEAAGTVGCRVATTGDATSSAGPRARGAMDQRCVSRARMCAGSTGPHGLTGIGTDVTSRPSWAGRAASSATACDRPDQLTTSTPRCAGAPSRPSCEAYSAPGASSSNSVGSARAVTAGAGPHPPNHVTTARAGLIPAAAHATRHAAVRVVLTASLHTGPMARPRCSPSGSGVLPVGDQPNLLASVPCALFAG